MTDDDDGNGDSSLLQLHSKIVLDPIFNLFFVSSLLDIALEVLALDQIRDIILLVVLLALNTGLVLLHVLVALGKLAQRRKTVGAQLVQDTGDQLGEFLLLAVTVQGEGVGGDGGVHCFFFQSFTLVLRACWSRKIR